MNGLYPKALAILEQVKKESGPVGGGAPGWCHLGAPDSKGPDSFVLYVSLGIVGLPPN